MHEKAGKIAADALRGIGGPWEEKETGEIAVHVRRRLSSPEIRQLFQILPSAPVFTHGKANIAQDWEATA